MRKVYKYPLRVTDEQEIEIPYNAECLSVQMQDGQVCLWALVNPDAVMSKLRILIAGTGHPIDENEIFKYISTFQMHGGKLVFHAFIGYKKLTTQSLL